MISTSVNEALLKRKEDRKNKKGNIKETAEDNKIY